MRPGVNVPDIFLWGVKRRWVSEQTKTYSDDLNRSPLVRARFGKLESAGPHESGAREFDPQPCQTTQSVHRGMD